MDDTLWTRTSFEKVSCVQRKGLCTRQIATSSVTDLRKYLLIVVEVALASLIGWAAISYIFLAFWANQWLFNDLIAWTIISVAAVVVTGLMWALHHFVIRRFIFD